jgi:hypothetical protein
MSSLWKNNKNYIINGKMRSPKGISTTYVLHMYIYHNNDKAVDAVTITCSVCVYIHTKVNRSEKCQLQVVVDCRYIVHKWDLHA